MTRDEAIDTIKRVEGRRIARGYDWREETIELLVELGLLKLDEPKPLEERVCAVLNASIGPIQACLALDQLKNHGFKIVKA